jgi:N-acetylglucosamine kinase-like BadF-type ATPase
MYYVGMDGGGTSTSVIVGDAFKREIGRFDLGPSNYHIIGVDQLKILFAQVLDELRNRFMITAEEIAVLAFCGAGVDSEQDNVLVTKAIYDAGFVNHVYAVNDAVGAIVGANGVEEGAILISGTGSIAVGIDGEVLYRVGGWGHVADDEGSGYWIAKEALKAVFRAHDRRGSKTQLTDAVLKHLDLEKVEELVGFIHHGRTQKQHIAELAKYVLMYANSDQVACDIANEAAKELFDMGYTLMRNMNKEALVIKGCGSILLKSDVILNRLLELSKSICPSLKFELPDQDAATGALILAYLKR